MEEKHTNKLTMLPLYCNHAQGLFTSEILTLINERMPKHPAQWEQLVALEARAKATFDARNR